jgi:hypothetical protein
MMMRTVLSANALLPFVLGAYPGPLLDLCKVALKAL